jgi:hypothetical protein
MAKMFYTLDETKAALGKTDDEIKELTTGGRLREFKDGNRLMYKTDQVEQLKRDMAAGAAEEIDLADSIGLAPEDPPPLKSASGITLADSATGSKSGTKVGTKAGSGAAGGTRAGSAAPSPSDDTALAMDLGLSGSAVPSSGKAASSSGLAGSSHGSRGGIDIFQTDETEKADPSAQTSIAPGLGSDQLNIESVGSGSGLLDLTRESDDTSLGAELMDEIAPGASGVRRAPAESSLSASALGGSSMGGTGAAAGIGDLPASAPSRQAPAMVEAPDSLAAAFGLAAAGGAGVILFAVFALVCGLAGDHPALLQRLGSTADGGWGFLAVLGLTFALPVILFGVGLFSAKMGRK